MSLPKLLLYIVIGLVVLVGGITGYLWYDTKKQVDQMAQMASLFAEVRYDGIHASPLGSVGVDGVKILPHGLDDEIRIDAIRIHSPHIFAWFGIKKALNQGRLPESLALSIDNITLQLYGSLIHAIFAHADTHKAASMENCGNVEFFGPNELQAMGYTALKIDFDLRYDYDEQLLNTMMQFGVQDMLSFTVEMGLASEASSASFASLQQKPPKLAGLKITLKDASLNERITRFCTQRSGRSAEEYVAGQVKQFAEELDRQGIALGPGLVEAYRRYIQKADQVTVAIAPKSPLDIQALQHSPPEELRNMLNVSLVVNQAPVTDLSLTFHPPKEPPHEPAAVATPAPEPAPPEPVERKRYQSVPVADVSKYIGSAAIIRTVNGQEHRGRLEALNEDGDAVRLAMRVQGGMVTYSIKLKKISGVMVLK